jgi:4-alpha-glucanotransferase
MKRRASGILLHITSLPSPFGIGDLGPWAYRFADFLGEGKQSFWQILPVNPTSLVRGNSPYGSLSAFAGNPILISPQSLADEGFLSERDMRDSPSSSDRVDYQTVMRYKEKIFQIAYRNFKKKRQGKFEFDCFCSEHSHWLEDYALFIALRDHQGGLAWSRWPSDIRDRNTQRMDGLKKRFRERMEIESFLQYLFFKQWASLKRYCNTKGIQIIGDLPIYMDYDGPDVWANPEIFKLDPNRNPLVVSGIPPDYFSSTGQLWGNPIYCWDILKERNYSWWLKRVSHNLKLFDFVRLDHFKGFADYWEVPAGETTAVNGRWVKGPGADFFNGLLKHLPYLPFIAEDLGVITAEVHQLRDRFGFPGMRVLQFAFGSDPLAEEYRPVSYIENCVAYTGTHDNDTLMGWLYGEKDYSTRNPDEIARERKNALSYLGGRSKRRKDIHWELIRLLMMSAASLVIIPMQDLLGLGGEARMNRPGKAEGNWEWRLTPGQLTSFLTRRLAEMTETYGRA